MPVLEALRDPAMQVAKVVIAHGSHGRAIDDIVRAATSAGTPIEWASAAFVTSVARNGRHHQGVAADIEAPNLTTLGAFLDTVRGRSGWAGSVLLLDGVHNPANVGMILRSATAAGTAGVVVPRRGTADLGPLVFKASAGVAFVAPILRCAAAEEAAELLAGEGFELVGLSAEMASGTESLFTAGLAARAAYVVGNETSGVSEAVRARVDRWVHIPLAGGVESLNVACAATLVAYEVARRTPEGDTAAGPVRPLS